MIKSIEYQPRIESDTLFRFYQIRNGEQKSNQIKNKPNELDIMPMQSFHFYHLYILLFRDELGFDASFEQTSISDLPKSVRKHRRHPRSFLTKESLFKANCRYWDYPLQNNSPISIIYDQKYKGFKVRARRRCSFREVKACLAGYALEIPTTDSLLLQDLKHSSLIESPVTKIGIPMIGLLKFVNHYCDSQLTYNFERNKDKTQACHYHTKSIQGTNFYIVCLGHSLGYLDCEIPGYKEHDEITVNYFIFKQYFTCNCNSSNCFSKCDK
jgi:hypothetical protein